MTTYNGLRALEKETTAKITSVVGTRRQKDDKKEVDKKAVVFPVGYVKRGDRYRHTLDTGKLLNYKKIIKNKYCLNTKSNYSAGA